MLACFIVALTLAVLASAALLWRCYRARWRRQRQSEAETAAAAVAGAQAALWADVERGRGVVVTQAKGPPLFQKAMVVLQPDGCARGSVAAAAAAAAAAASGPGTPLACPFCPPPEITAPTTSSPRVLRCQGVACPCVVETRDAGTQVLPMELSPRGSAAAAAIAGVRVQDLLPPLRVHLTELPAASASAAPAPGLRRSASALEGGPLRPARQPQPARALSAGSASGLYPLQEEAGAQEGAAPPPDRQPEAPPPPQPPGEGEPEPERPPSRPRRREDRGRRSTGCQTD